VKFNKAQRIVLGSPWTIPDQHHARLSKPMRRFILKLRRFAASEEGPTAVEYAVMLSLIVAICLAAVKSVGNNTKTVFTNAANSLGS
jgi:pilus assembly protein Flp/PilA